MTQKTTNPSTKLSTQKLTAIQDQPQTTILDYGTISGIAWHGSVSAQKMIDTNLTTPLTIDEAVRTINDFYVDVDTAARTRCIDGRLDPQSQDDHLGPQVPGGAPGAALAYRLGVDKDDLTRGTFFADAESMVDTYLRLGFAPGGHRDEHSDGQARVGCGAIDAMDAILAAMTDPGLVEDHKRVVKMLLGHEFDRDTYLRIMGAAVVVNGRSSTYFQGRQAIIDLLEARDKNSVTTLKGTHQECVVAVNTVPFTTLSSNDFSAAYHGMQAFGYDIWYSKQIAEKIMPRPDQAMDRQRFVTARVMCTVATLMVLTDGSQRLVVRVPAES